MRFESKHLYFTKLVKVVNNFKNICSTLAMRHQLMQAYHLSCESSFKIADIKLSKTVDVDICR
jgi:muramidase (phage lysozyme)